MSHIYVNGYLAWTRQSYNAAYTTFSCLARNNYWPVSACGRTATCCRVFMVFAATKGNQSFNMMDDSRRQSGKAFCVSSYNVEESVMYELQLHCLLRESLICLVSNGKFAYYLLECSGPLKSYNIGYTMCFASQILEPFVTTCLQITFWMAAKYRTLRLF